MDRVFISPGGKVLQSKKDVDQFLLSSESVASDLTDYSTDHSVFNTRNPVHGLAPNRRPANSLRITPDESDDFNHVLKIGGEVKAREGLWKDFVTQKLAASASNVRQGRPRGPPRARVGRSARLGNAVTVRVIKPSNDHLLGIGVRQSIDSVEVIRIDSNGLCGGTKLRVGMLLDTINGHACRTCAEVGALFGMAKDSITIVAKKPVSDYTHLRNAHATRDRTRKRKRRRKDEHSEGADSRTKGQPIHPSDWKLYHPIISQTESCKQKGFEQAENNKKGFNSYDVEDDIVIPDHYLVTQSNNEPGTTAACYQRQLQQLRSHQSINNLVKYNNIVREQHNYYTSEGPDRHWDQEFGDGIDPAVFVEECCRGSTDAAAMEDGQLSINSRDSQDVSKKFGNDKVADRAQFAATQYTGSLLQRCWDRAVHAAASTVTVEPCRGATEPKNNVKREDTMEALPNEGVINSVLHREAMNVVESLLDIVLARDESLPAEKRFNSNIAESDSVNWRHVLNRLQSAAAQGEKGEHREGAPSGPAIHIQANASRRPIPLNCISLKALSMRLIDRYDIRSHNET